MNEFSKESEDSLLKELEYLRFCKNKLLQKIIELDTSIIGIKEELRGRKELAIIQSNIFNMVPDEGI